MGKISKSKIKDLELTDGINKLKTIFDYDYDEPSWYAENKNRPVLKTNTYNDNINYDFDESSWRE